MSELVSIASLVFDPANARKHDKKNLDAIKGSLARFGQQKPIVILKDNVVIAGNGTLAAARELGWNEIEVKRSKLTGVEAIAYALADNRSAELAAWDDEILGKTLHALQEDGFPIADIGFDPGDFWDEKNEGLTDPDEIPEVPQNVRGVERGQIWQLGDHRMMCGDSTSKDDVERLMNGEKADMVFTDPPYGVDYEGINNDHRSGLENLLRKSFSSIQAKPGSPTYVFHSDRCADIFHIVFREFFHFSSMIIWAKPSLVMSQTDYQSKHEPCMYGWVIGGKHEWYSDRKQTSIFEVGRENVDGHTTPKPVEFIEIAVNNSSKAGSLIVDPFLGSGSTLIACEKTNRKCFGMEIDPHYCSVIIERWEKFSGKKAILCSGINQENQEAIDG